MREGDFLTELGSLAVVTRLKRVSDAMLHDGRRMYKELGLDIEPNWFAVFMLLEKRGPQSVTQIADAIGLSHPSVISILNKMLKAGYLDESRDDGDSRKRILSLTPKAAGRLAEFSRIWDAGTAGVKRMLPDVDLLKTLNVLEDRIATKGFRSRTLAELSAIKQVEVVTYDDRYREDYANLNYEWIETSFVIEDHDREQLDDPVKYVIEPGGEIFFALVDGVAAGTVAMIKATEETYELAKMAVSPQYRGYRLSDKLIDACVDFARSRGAKTIFLESNTKQLAAINLYLKHGFVETPLDPNSHYARVNIRMEKRIT